VLSITTGSAEIWCVQVPLALATVTRSAIMTLRGQGQQTAESAGTKCTITNEQVATRSPNSAKMSHEMLPADNFFIEKKMENAVCFCITLPHMASTVFGSRSTKRSKSRQCIAIWIKLHRETNCSYLPLVLL